MIKEVVKKTVKLYDGKVTIEFNSLARNRYTIMETGSSPVGVTTILQSLAKPGLMLWPLYEGIEWLKKHPEDFDGAEKAYLIKSDRGKDVGTEIHSAVETLLSGHKAPITVTPESEKAYHAFEQWFATVNPKVLATEQIIYSKKYDYAGTYDALLEIDGQVILADCKTTNTSRSAPLGIYPEYLLQLGAYSLAHHEENPLEKIDDAMIIRVGKDGKLNTLSVSDMGLKLDYLEDTFTKLVELYKFMIPLAKQLSEKEK